MKLVEQIECMIGEFQIGTRNRPSVVIVDNKVKAMLHKEMDIVSLEKRLSNVTLHSTELLDDLVILVNYKTMFLAVRKLVLPTQTTWTLVKNDLNGNPRYVCHYLTFIAATDGEKHDHSKFYDIACKRAKKLGGNKYRGKDYGGGIVFQSYNIEETTEQIRQLLAKEESNG
jgi:hypothetical protein